MACPYTQDNGVTGTHYRRIAGLAIADWTMARTGRSGMKRAGFGMAAWLIPTAWAIPLAWGAPPAADPASIVTLQVENDAVSTYRGTSDQYYTSGVRLGYVAPTTATPDFLTEFGRTVWGDGTQRISVQLAQSIFTPRNTQARPPDPRDRPYAGYLHADAALIHDTTDTRSVLQVSLGVVGPSALGEQVQNGFHGLIGDTPNRGWKSQLRDEPAVEVLLEQTYRLPVTRFSGVEVDALPALTAGIGTVRDYVQVGGTVRFGQGLDSDFGAPRIRPGLSGSDAYTPTRPFAWYVFAGLDGQAIGRDIFLDGSTFRNSPHTTKRAFLGEAQAGLAVMAFGVRLTYTQVFQTPSFDRQRSGLFNFGSLALSARF